MPTQFSQTTRALQADRSAFAPISWLTAGVLLAGWGAWLAFAEVTIHEVSTRGWLEVQQSPHVVAPLTDGWVAHSLVTLGQQVHAGDVLLTMDDATERMRLAEEEARLSALPLRIAASRRELEAMDRLRTDERQASRAAIEAARARVEEAAAAATFARQHEIRLREQSRAGGVPQIDALRARAELQQRIAERDALAAEVRRLELEQQARASRSDAQANTLQRDIATLEGEEAATRAVAERLRTVIGHTVLRAPVDGRIGDIARLHPGAYAAAGQRLLSVVPDGPLVVIADFPPPTAMGRIHPGQRARMRLDGFPWVQFGSLEAVVTTVASEARDGGLRVEFSLIGNPPATLAQHGLSGTIEVEVERVTPATLVLRAGGLLLGMRRPRHL